jgi:hypothetical protein
MDVMKFFLANSPQDYEDCQTLMDEQDVTTSKLEFPTVLARDADGVLLGFLSSYYQDKMLFAGPLVVKKHRPRTAMNLCEQYDLVCKSMGLTGYLMATEDDTFMDKGIKRYDLKGFEPYAREGNRTFYIRRL